MRLFKKAEKATPAATVPRPVGSPSQPVPRATLRSSDPVGIATSADPKKDTTAVVVGSAELGIKSSSPTPTMRIDLSPDKAVQKRHLSVSDILLGATLPPSADGSEMPGALEFVVKSFCAEWLAQADAKLRDFMILNPSNVATPTANDLSDQLVVDQSFEQLLVSLGRVSRRVLGLVVNVVLTWRRNKIKDAVMTGQRPAVLTTDDRVLLGAEFLCCETLVSVLSFVSKENVGDGAGAEWCSEVETMCFQNVIPGRANNDLIRHKFAQALACLAPYRLAEITAKFKQYVAQFQAKPDAKNQAMIEPILGAMASLKLDISNQPNYLQVTQFLTVFVDLMLQSKGKLEDIRPLLVQSMAAVLAPLLQYSRALPSGVDYSKWFQFVSATYAALYSKLVEPKNPRESRTPNYPLLVTLLCLQDRDVFMATYSSLADHITANKTIKKDKKTGNRLNFTFLLEALYTLVDHFTMQEFGKSHLLAQGNFLELVTTRLFDIRERKLGALPDESLDWMVKILTRMAQKSPLLTLRDINKLLVSTEAGFMQKKLVGVRALRGICEAGVDVLEHSPTAGEVLSEVFAQVHNDVGTALLTGNKPLPQDDHGVSVVLLCEMIFACYHVTPVKIGTTKLFAMLASYLIHVAPAVRSAAETVLVQFLTNRAGLRAPLVQIIAEMPLAISDLKPDVIEIALTKLNWLLNCWNKLLSAGAGSNEDPMELNFGRLEGLALVFLCSARSKVRLKAWEMTELLRSLSQAGAHLRGHDADEAPGRGKASLKGAGGETSDAVRLRTVLEEMESDTIQTFNNDFRFRRIENPTFRRFDNMTLQSLLANEATVASQLCWTFYLGSVLKIAPLLCPQATAMARNLVVLRINKVPVVPDKTVLTHEHQLTIDLWRNYAVLLVAATLRQSFDFDSWVSALAKRDEGNYPTTPQQVLVDVVTRTATNSLYQQHGTMALGRVCFGLLPTLCITLDEQLVEGKAFPNKRTMGLPGRVKGPTTLPPHHWEIFASVLSRAAEGFAEERGILSRDTVLGKFFVHHLGELHKFLSSSDAVTDSEYFAHRYSMLVLIRCVSTELNIPMPSRGWNMEKQLRNGLFMWIKHWSQGAALLDAPSIQEQILAKLRVTRSTEKPEDFKRVLREQLQILHYFAVQAAAALIADPFDAPITRDHVVVQWLNKMLQETSPAKSTSNIRDAVGQFLQGNHMQWGCLTMALDQCYTRETDEVSRFVADMWFLAVVELMEMCPGVQRPMAEMLHLVLCRIGKDNLTIRRNALKLLQLLSASNGRWEEYDALAIDSELDDTYRYTQQRLSEKLALAYETHAVRVFDEMVIRTDSLDETALSQALDYIIPWVAKLQLYLSSESVRAHTLYNMCLMTHRYQTDRPMQVQRMWSTLASDQGNVDPIIEFLLRVGVKKRNASFIPLAKKVVLYISRANGEATVAKLVDELQAVDKGDKQGKKSSVSPRGTPRASASTGAPVPGRGRQELRVELGRKGVSGEATTATTEPDHPFHHVMPDLLGQNSLPVLRGHLALIMTSELAFEVGELLRDSLAVILQQLFLGFHNSQPVVYEHSRMLLLNLVHALVVDRYSQAENPSTLISQEDYEEALQVVELLKGRAKKQVFYGNQSSLLTTLVESVVSVLTPKFEEPPSDEYRPLADMWAEQAFQWALKCPVPMLASISYQIYRALCPVASKEELATLLEALGRMMKAKNNMDSVMLTGQILQTLRAVLEHSDVNNLTFYTNLFWGASAVLMTDVEDQFVQACTILDTIVSTLNFSDSVVSNVFLASVPDNAQFAGVQPRVIRGLWAATTEPYTVRLLVKFLGIPSTCDSIVQPRQRVISTVIALLPWMCIVDKSMDVADKLGRFLVASGQKELGNAFAQSKSSKDVQSFVSAIGGPFAEAFFPQHELFVMKFFFDLLDRGPVKYNKPILHLLQILLPSVNFSDDSFKPFVPRWMSVLERKVNGPLVQLALDILDTCMAQSQLPPSSAITLGKVAMLAPAEAMHYEFLNVADEGNRSSSLELVELVKRSGLAGVEGGVEELASQAFFAKFFPDGSDGSASTNSNVPEEQQKDPAHARLDTDTMSDVHFGDDMMLGGFGESSSFFDSVLSEGGNTAAPSGNVEAHSQLHDQFNNYMQLAKHPMAAEMAFELGKVLLGAYTMAVKEKLPTLANDDVALLISKYSKMLSGEERLKEYADTATTGFKASAAQQKLLAVAKADRPQVEKVQTAALGLFNERHSAFLAAKALFEKRQHAADRSKPGEVKVLSAMIDMHQQLVRLIGSLLGLRAAFDNVETGGASTALAGLQALEEKSRGALNELLGL